MKNFILILTFVTATISWGQIFEDTAKGITLQFYTDIYYQIDNSKNEERPVILYSYRREREITSNLSYLKLGYNKDRVRGTFTGMAGTYAQYNLAAEPLWAQFVMEANMGYKLSKKHSLWLDAGILPSHIGFESAVSHDCWTVSRSLLAENSPYFETGARLSYISKNDKHTLNTLLINGWQKIQKTSGFNRPSLGLQWQFKINKQLLFNYSNYLGFNKPDSVNSFMHFHNLYFQTEGKKISWTIGFDIGNDLSSTGKRSSWFSPIIIGKYTDKKNRKLAIRAEYYQDVDQALIVTGTTHGFDVFGASINYDVPLNNHLFWRTEVRYFNSKYSLYASPDANHSNKDNVNLLMGLSLKL